MTTMEIVRKADYDILIEMTPLNIFSGQPAISHIEEAFARGKDVVTANKGPIAWRFSALKKMAEEKECKFFYETTVMDGTPVFNLVEKTLPLAKVTEVSGILNSTTNFILEEMAKGSPYDDIISRGKAMGFIEADPAMDIEGYDAAAKITALLNVLMDADMTPDQVDRKGIEDITAEQIQEGQCYQITVQRQAFSRWQSRCKGKAGGSAGRRYACFCQQHHIRSVHNHGSYEEAVSRGTRA